MAQYREVVGELICVYPTTDADGKQVAKIALNEWWTSPDQYAALRARVEALEAFVQDLADESCLDRGSHRNQEACGETNLRLIDYCGPCRARALLEQKP